MRSVTFLTARVKEAQRRRPDQQRGMPNGRFPIGCYSRALVVDKNTGLIVLTQSDPLEELEP